MKNMMNLTPPRFSRTLKMQICKNNGLLVDSFDELDPVHADHYRNVVEERHGMQDQFHYATETQMIKLKGRQASIDEHEFLRWLNSKKPNSAGFACFGGTGELEFSQVMEIAIGL